MENALNELKDKAHKKALLARIYINVYTALLILLFVYFINSIGFASIVMLIAEIFCMFFFVWVIKRNYDMYCFTKSIFDSM